MLNSLYCNYAGVPCRLCHVNATQPFFLVLFIPRSAETVLPHLPYIQRPDVIPILMPDPVVSTSTCVSDDPRHSMVVRLPNRPVSARIKARSCLEQVSFGPPPKHSSCLLPSTINHNHCMQAPLMAQAESLANGSWRSCFYNCMKPLLCTLHHILGFRRRTIPQSLEALCSSMSSLSAFAYLVSMLPDVLSLCCCCRLAFYNCCTYSGRAEFLRSENGVCFTFCPRAWRPRHMKSTL